MSYVAKLVKETGFDITLNAELIVAPDSAMLHFGAMGYGSGFVMVWPEFEADEEGFAQFGWRFLDSRGDSIMSGEHVDESEGDAHPVQWLLALVETVLAAVDAGEDAVAALGDWGLDHGEADPAGWMADYVAPHLEVALDDLRAVIDHLAREPMDAGGERPKVSVPCGRVDVSEGDTMSEMQWIRSHVERLLQEHWDSRELYEDRDGDYPFRAGTAMCWVSVLDSEPVMVRVFAHAAFGVKPSLKFYRELNELQRCSLSAHVAFGDGVVMVSQTLSPIGLTLPVLTQAMGAVASMAEDIGTLVAAMFGGSTPFPASSEDAEEEVA